MFRPLPLFIGLRYTRAKRRNHFISFILLSVMNGFDRELRTRILGMVPHATISSYQPIDDWQAVAARVAAHPDVQAVAPFSQLQGMLSHSGGVQPVLVNAVLPEAEKQVSIIDQHMVQGRLEDLASGEFGMIIGEITARRFRVEVGDKLTFILPEASVTPAGVFPRLKRFTVVGVFKVGAELDSSLALIHVGDAARLARWQEHQVEGVRLKLNDLFQAPRVAWEIAASFSGEDYVARDWTRSHGSLFQAIQMEKTMIALLLLLIVAVAAFNIISTLVMVVTDKKADIAILRTLGMTPRQIMLVFMVQGSVIGVVGTLIGGVLGVIAALNITAWVAGLENLLGQKFLSSDVYFINYLPSQLRVEDVVLICSAALLMSFFATLYPAWKAARTQPAEALRYE